MPLRVLSGAAFAGGLVVAGARAGPARRGAWRSGTRSCRCRSRRSSPRRCAVRRRGSCTAARRPGAKGASCASIASESRSICSSRKSMCARIAPIMSAWWALEAALERLAERRDLRRAACPSRESASTSGSVVPATSASSIARPETPRMSVATQSSLIPVSSSALCSRFASRWRARWICVLRYRVRFRSSPDRLGRHEARRATARPPAAGTATRASLTSVLRPGTTRSTDCVSCVRRCRRG